MADEKTRSLRGWYQYLCGLDQREELTREDLRDLALLSIMNHSGIAADRLGPLTDAMEHVEGMAGARDAFDAMLAEQRGLPYPSSAKVRALLDADRDERRRLAAERRKQLEGGNGHV